MSGAPDFNFVFPGQLRFNHFSANRGGSFLAPSVPRPPGTIYVMEARDSGVETVVFAEMAAHPLGKQLFPAVAIFRQRRVGIFFLQLRRFKALLFVTVVDAGRGGIKVASDAVLHRR